MPKSAARLKLNTDETIGNLVTRPEVLFNSVGNKSMITIRLAFNAIGDIINDSETPTTGPIKTNYRDALTDDGTNFVTPGNMVVRFQSNGTMGGCRIFIEGDLGTKIPGTGAKFIKKTSVKKNPTKHKKST